jgi:FlaA1/EpsC-like NDP-sugar epimerase
LQPKRGFLSYRGFHLKKIWVLYAIDMMCVAGALGLSYELRFSWKIPDADFGFMKTILVISLLIYSISFYLFGFYRRLWRYASENDLVAMIVANVLATIAVKAFDFVLNGDIPTSVWLSAFLCTLSTVAGTRLFWKVYTMDARRSFVTHTMGRLRVVIYGAGFAGVLVAKQIKADSTNKYELVGFIDDDPAKLGLNLCGVRILGSGNDVQHLIHLHEASQLIIAIPSLGRNQFRDLIDKLNKYGVPILTVPPMAQWIHKPGVPLPLRPVQVEDLLGREPLPINVAQVGNYLKGKIVLITGGGGSIGSEICRQVATIGPKQLIVLGRGENSVFEILQELHDNFHELPTVSVIANITDAKKMESVFRTYRPDIVFHAAAHKHVPFMEYHPDEAFVNNVLGTKYLVELSVLHDVQKFVLVSSDKAVRPTNVMGASKRISEMVVQAFSKDTGSTRFITVRFGNVLGSRGSVVQIFRKQIANGGPVTITDPRMERYFMTIPEAGRLVVEAGSIGCDGEVLLFDMGEPVRIVDLAERMVRLSGCEPGLDIPIEFTGIRPGEKLCEELAREGDIVDTLGHGRILRVQCPSMPFAQLITVLGQMQELYESEKLEQLATFMKELAWWKPSDMAEEGNTRALAITLSPQIGEVAYGRA